MREVFEKNERQAKGSIMLDLSSSTRKTNWFAKDQAKAKRANKFIGRGSPSSSTNAYAHTVGALANCGNYTPGDAVFVSAEGARRERLDPNFAELRLAVAAGVTFITDGPTDRERPYNCGERAVAAFLRVNGYLETTPGTWTTQDPNIARHAKHLG